MTFDPFANQGGAAAWDPEATAKSNRDADALFAAEQSEIRDDELIPGEEPQVGKQQNPGDRPNDELIPSAGNPEQPGELPDPDLGSDAAEE